jgi:hypothetical protein
MIVAPASFVALLYARYLLATTFLSYDDEGYLLLSLDRYLKGGSLYSEVFSQYGPFLFYAQAAVFRILHLPVTHDAGRLVTLLWWMLSAILGGYFIYRISQSIVLASAAALACTRLASFLADQPGHPQQLILPILMLACCASVWFESGSFSLLLSGALGAALVLTKINVGILYLAALGHVLICSLSRSLLRTIGAGLSLAYALAFPLLLMRQDLAGWAGAYCLLAVLSGVLTFLAGLLVMPPSRNAVRGILYAAGGVLAGALAIVGGTLLQGMPLAILLDGVVWGPLKHPKVFAIPLLVAKAKMSSAILVSGCIAALYWRRQKGWEPPDWIDALRCVIGLCTVPLLAFVPGRVVWILPFLPLGLAPVKGRSWQAADFFPRLFVAALAVTQFLSAYPVSGLSQIGIAAAPVLLWAFICIHDGAEGLFSLMSRVTDRLTHGFPKQSLIGALMAVVLMVAMLQPAFSSLKYPYPASHLAGSSSLHLQTEVENRFLFLAGSIRENCDSLFTLPGLGSLNFWSGIPTPNGSNLTAWMKGFDAERQQEILSLLQADTRACTVYNPAIASDTWGSTVDNMSSSPLAYYITHDMRKIAERDGYEIRVHPQRELPWKTEETSSSSRLQGAQ